MDRPWPLLPSQSLFISLDINVSEKEKVLDSLKSNHLEYLYLNNKVKQKHLQTTNPYIAQNRDIKLPTEELILRHSQKVFSAGDCEVFKINEKKLQAAYH
jgi:hypothetical protein